MSTERQIQAAIASALTTSPHWPQDADVIQALPGDLETAIRTALGKTSLCVVVGEPDNIESLPGECTFIQSSDWTLTIFSTELLNPTGTPNLDAALLIRSILGNNDLGGLLAEPLSRCRISFTGEQDGIVVRTVTFTAAYQS